MNNKKDRIVICSFVVMILLVCEAVKSQDIPMDLSMVNEIGPNFSKGGDEYFWRISDLSVDDEGNIYVADSGWNRIFKFNSDGAYIMSFGSEGQGPGEFLADPISNTLKLSFGRDGFIYVTDPGNGRFSVFSKDGEFVRSVKTDILSDDVVANSKGNIYLLQNRGPRLICCYTKERIRISCILDRQEHFEYPILKPKNPIYDIDGSNLQKAITYDDKLVILSNYALKVFVYDQSHEKVSEFSIENQRLVQDISERLRTVMKRNENGFLIPFTIAIDDESLCLCYFNWTDQANELYRYSLEGELVSISRFPIKIRMNCVVNLRGRVFAAIGSDRIGVFKVADGSGLSGPSG